MSVFKFCQHPEHVGLFLSSHTLANITAYIFYTLKILYILFLIRKCAVYIIKFKIDIFCYLFRWAYAYTFCLGIINFWTHCRWNMVSVLSCTCLFLVLSSRTFGLQVAGIKTSWRHGIPSSIIKVENIDSKFIFQCKTEGNWQIICFFADCHHCSH